MVSVPLSQMEVSGPVQVSQKSSWPFHGAAVLVFFSSHLFWFWFSSFLFRVRKILFKGLSPIPGSHLCSPKDFDFQYLYMSIVCSFLSNLHAVVYFITKLYVRIWMYTYMVICVVMFIYIYFYALHILISRFDDCILHMHQTELKYILIYFKSNS